MRANRKTFIKQYKKKRKHAVADALFPPSADGKARRASPAPRPPLEPLPPWPTYTAADLAPDGPFTIDVAAVQAAVLASLDATDAAAAPPPRKSQRQRGRSKGAS